MHLERPFHDDLGKLLDEPLWYKDLPFKGGLYDTKSMA